MYSAMSVISAPGGLLAGGLGGGGVSRAEPVLLVSERPVPEGIDNYFYYVIRGRCRIIRINFISV